DKQPTAVKPQPSAQSPDKIELKVIKHADLVKAIEAHKGKVVLVDFWATWCPPCVAKFPKVVHLHEQFQAKGLVCISASFNELPQKEKALKFLNDKKAFLENYLIEDTENSQNEWNFK